MYFFKITNIVPYLLQKLLSWKLVIIVSDFRQVGLFHCAETDNSVQGDPKKEFITFLKSHCPDATLEYKRCKIQNYRFQNWCVLVWI